MAEMKRENEKLPAGEAEASSELFLGMISLRTCPERRAFFERGWKEQARKFLPATASEAERQDPSFLGAKMYYHVADLDPEGGVLGCTRSHMALYQKAIDSTNAKAAIVFEDDVKVNGHFTPSVIRDCLALMDTWDVVRFHKTGICKIHGCLSDNLFHSSNLCGRAYMISRPLMEYVLRFDSKEVVPYTYFLPKASARQLTYHPSLITEGAFGSWNTKGFGRAAGAKQDDDTSCLAPAAPSRTSSSASSGSSSCSSVKTTTPSSGPAAKKPRPGPEVAKQDAGGSADKKFSALAFLQWSLKYTTAIEQTVANVHFFTNLPSPLFNDTTFPRAETFWSKCREEHDAGNRFSRVQTFAEYRQRIGRYDSAVKGVCPRRLSAEGVHYFGYVKSLRRLLFGAETEYAESKDVTEKSVPRGNDDDAVTHLRAVERLQLARREERTGLGFGYEMVAGAGSCMAAKLFHPGPPSKSASSCVEIAAPVKHAHLQQPTTDFDVIVVGAGIAGSSCAWTFANAGAKVLLVEQWDVLNENKRKLSSPSSTSSNIKTGKDHHKDNDYFESMGSSRGGPRRIGTLDLAPGTRVREAWTAWCDMKAMAEELAASSSSSKKSASGPRPPPLLDVIGEVLVVDIFPFGWLLLVFFLIWWLCRRIFAGADSLPRGLELLWNREQLLSKLPKDAFRFRSANVFGIYYADAAALYTKEILQHFHAAAVPARQLDEMVASSSSSEDHDQRCTSSSEAPPSRPSSTQTPSDYSILGKTKVVNVRRESNAAVVVDCVENLAAASFDAGNAGNGMRDAKPTALRAKHVVIAGGGWTGELLKKMGFENARTKIGVFTCPSYDVNVVAKEGRSSCTQKPSPAKGGKRKDAVAPQVGVAPLSVENKCPLFAFPAARIYGFPMACGHDGHQVMSIRPNYPSTWCQDPENHAKFDEHLHVVDSFLTEYVRPDALVPSAASPKSPNKTLPPRRPTPTAASPSRKSAPGKPHHQPLNHAPLNSYTCRYPQLAVDGKKFGAVMDFVPGYDNRVVLAAGFDGYGFKYGSLYGKEVLDLLVTHRRVSGLEWEKKPAENLLLRWLHAIIDLLLKAAGGDEGDADEEATSRFPLHFGFVVLAACWAYLAASSVLFGSTLSGLFTTLFVLNIAYTLGSEWFYRTPKTFSDWQRVGVIWGVHYAWALGAPVAVSAFVSHLLCAPPDIGVSGGGSDTGLRQAPGLLLFSCLLTLGGIYLRYRSMDECDHYDRSARGLQLGDDEFKLGVDQKCGKEQTGKRASSSKNKKPAAPGSSGKKKTAPSSPKLPSSEGPEDGSQTSFARQDRVVTMTGIYSYCRHPGFAAHILHATAVAMAVVVFFRVYGSAGTTTTPAAEGSTSSSPALSETGLLTAARAVFTQAAALQEFLRGLLWSVVIPLVHFQVAYVIFVMSANAEEKEFLAQEDFREAYLHYQVVVPTQFNFLTKLLEPVGEAIRGVRCGGNNERRVFLRLLGLIQGTPVDFLDPVEEPELIEKVLEGSNKGHFIEDLIACPAWQPVRSVESVQYHEAMRMKESLSHVFARTRVFDRIDSIIDECVARDPCLSRNSALSNMAKSNSTCTTVDCSDSERNLSMSQQISLVSTDSTDSPSIVPSRDHSIVGSQTGSDDGEKIVSEPEDGGGNGNSCSTGSTAAGSSGEVGGLTRQESSVGGTASTSSSSRPRTSSTGHAFSPPARGSRGSECKGGSASSTASSPKKGVAALPKKGIPATSASEDGGPIAGCADVTRHSFEIFFKVLTDRFPTESESRMAHAAVDEWRKMIAMKGQADSEKKVEFVDFMRRSLKESPFFQSNAPAPREESNYTNANDQDHHAADEQEGSTSVAPPPKQVVKRTTSEKMADEYVFNWDDMNCLSCVLQPMIISPMINFADVFTSMKTILDRHPHWREEIVAPTKFSETPAGIVPSPNVGAQLGLKERTRSEEVADKVILEGMRCAHPFPILERTVTRDVERNGETRFKKGTQVFIEYDQYCQGEKESSCPFLSGKMEGPGSGGVSCPFMTGQQSGKTAGTSDEKTATASPPSVFDPNRWHDEQKCVYRAVPFGSGVRRCFGQKVARVILRKLLVAYCRNWDRFEPSTGHAFSGRNNDSDPGDTFYVAKNLVRCLADGVKYRFGLSM
eukprot:CAMPEP_0178997406 /NCGR_PEP_ID=MMETSP0795-20121207/8906_1 /TAXON_ID=88552 /ORGANISM="Amoebophrya sp., Strain Ameob2" /LENGTH=2133 /DNA_ID=CAMNT_0020689903 /DNA_START=1017 /DNA_END=7418 /DNA_ORIENTATION=-